MSEQFARKRNQKNRVNGGRGKEEPTLSFIFIHCLSLPLTALIRFELWVCRCCFCCFCVVEHSRCLSDNTAVSDQHRLRRFAILLCQMQCFEKKYKNKQRKRIFQKNDEEEETNEKEIKYHPNTNKISNCN